MKYVNVLGRSTQFGALKLSVNFTLHPFQCRRLVYFRHSSTEFLSTFRLNNYLLASPLDLERTEHQ